MGDIYIIRHNKYGIFSNTDDHCAKCLSMCRNGSQQIVCDREKKQRRQGASTVGQHIAILCTDVATKSQRIFKEKLHIFSELVMCLDVMASKYDKEIKASISHFIHNIISLNAQSMQSIYEYIPQEEFMKQSRTELLKTIRDIILKSPNDIAVLLMDLLKNEKLEKTEISCYSKLLEHSSVDIKKHPIHKMVLLVLNTYWNEFESKGVRVKINKCFDNVLVDYEVLTATLVYIFENTVKYVLPKTDIDIRFEREDSLMKVIFDMISLKVEPWEKDKIFDHEYSGSNSVKLQKSGKGLGLYLSRKLLELINATIEFIPDYDKSKSETKMGIEFQNNLILLKLNM